MSEIHLGVINSKPNSEPVVLLAIMEDIQLFTYKVNNVGDFSLRCLFKVSK